jgi:dihydroorotase
MVQHALYIMLQLYKRGLISLEKIAEKMSHNVAILYGIEKRGYIREGYFADLTLVDLNSPWTVSKENVLYKCGWSPLEGETFHSKVTHTFVNGNVVYENGSLSRFCVGRRLEFKQESGAK